MPSASNFRSVVGKGVIGRVANVEVVLGNRTLLEEHGVPVDRLAEQAERLRAEGHTVVFLARDGILAGALSVVDPVKPSALNALRALHEAGLRVVMLTGDNRTTASAVAKRLGIDDVRADVLPNQKHDVVAELRAQGRTSPGWFASALSKAVMKNIRQNLFFAFFYNALGVPIAAGVAYPLFGLLLSPMLASAAMAVRNR